MTATLAELLDALVDDYAAALVADAEEQPGSPLGAWCSACLRMILPGQPLEHETVMLAQAGPWWVWKPLWRHQACPAPSSMTAARG